MGGFPRAQFLPQKPLMLRPRLKIADPPIETRQRASRARRWGIALLVTITAIGLVAYLAFLALLVVKGYLPGDFVPNKP